MKKQTIWLITGTMLIALVGLIGFQIYWINSTIKLNEERFNNDVYESLNFVINQLEKYEMFSYTSKAIDSLHSDAFVIPSPPSPLTNKNASYRKIKTKNGIKVIYESKDGRFQEEVEIEIQPGDSNSYSRDSLLLIKGLNDSIKHHHGRIEIEEERIKQKFEIFDVVMDEIVLKQKKSRRKLDLNQIDSLINISLTNKGINTTYEFIIWNQRSSKTILAKEKPSENFFKTQFKASLFPNDLISSSEFLMIHFPDQQSFLFNQIWGSLFASFFLITIILSCFGYSLFTIIKQKKISEIKNDFINNMTHEFKTPIATVALACEALQEQEILNDPGTSKRYLTIIKEENNRLENHVEKVLQLATLDKQSVKLQLENHDIHEIIERTIVGFEMQLRNRKGSLLKDLSATNRLVRVDHNHLANVITNLVDNAIKYSPEAPAITVATKSNSNSISVSIADKGIGMSNDEIKKVFEKFYRVSTGNIHDVKGFGLGLHYVKEILEMHRGNIKINSDLKSGSTFTFTLPLVQ